MKWRLGRMDGRGARRDWKRKGGDAVGDSLPLAGAALKLAAFFLNMAEIRLPIKRENSV